MDVSSVNICRAVDPPPGNTPMGRTTRAFACGAFALLFTAYAFPQILSADTVTLKDGSRIFNVRTYVSSEFVYVVGKDGSTTSIPRRQVKAVAHAQVDWSDAVASEKIKRLKEELARSQGRVRLAIISTGGPDDAGLKQIVTLLTAALTNAQLIVLEPGEVKQAIADQGERSEADVAADSLKAGALCRLLGVKGIVVVDVHQDKKTAVIRFLETDSNGFVQSAAFRYREKESRLAGTETAANDIVNRVDPAAMVRKFSYAWRSALLPGLGQWHKGRTDRAWMFGGGSGALAVSYLAFRKEHADAQKAYSRTTVPAFYALFSEGFFLNYEFVSRKRRELEARERTTNRAAALIGVVWLAGIIDAWAGDVRLIPNDAGKNAHFWMSPALESSLSSPRFSTARLNAGLTFRF